MSGQLIQDPVSWVGTSGQHFRPEPGLGPHISGLDPASRAQNGPKHPDIGTGHPTYCQGSCLHQYSGKLLNSLTGLGLAALPHDWILGGMGGGV